MSNSKVEFRHDVHSLEVPVVSGALDIYVGDNINYNAVHHPAAGVHHRKLAAVPFALAVLTVARGARLVAHNGLARLRQPIEKCGFSHVGASHNRY